MSRTCTICTHVERRAIDQALVAQQPYRTIGDRYGLSHQALIRHKADHVLADIVAAWEAEREQNRQDLADDLRCWKAYITKLLEACDRWLADPDDPTRYDLGPRAHEVLVHYEEPDGKRVRRRKARLADLLERARAEHPGITVTLVEHKSADPRKLIIDAAARLDGHQRLLAELVGKLQTQGTINVTTSPEWIEVRGLLIEALSDFPEARAAVAQALLQVNHDNG